MVASKRLLERMKKAKAKAEEQSKPGILPLVAYYGRDQEQEESRSRMYAMVERVSSSRTIWPVATSAATIRDGYTFLNTRDAVTILNAQSSPIEFLVSNGEMELGQDEDGMGGVRFHTAIRFRDLVAGAQVKGLKSANLDGVGGGSGGAPIDIMAYQVDCRKILHRVRSSIPEEWVYRVVEAVTVNDDWLDLWPEPMKNDKRGVKRKQRLKTILALHYGLDRVGQALGYMNHAAFVQRWPQGAPPMPPSARDRNQGSRVANQLALLTSQDAPSE